MYIYIYIYISELVACLHNIGILVQFRFASTFEATALSQRSCLETMASANVFARRVGAHVELLAGLEVQLEHLDSEMQKLEAARREPSKLASTQLEESFEQSQMPQPSGSGAAEKGSDSDIYGRASGKR